MVRITSGNGANQAQSTATVKQETVTPATSIIQNPTYKEHLQHARTAAQARLAEAGVQTTAQKIQAESRFPRPTFATKFAVNPFQKNQAGVSGIGLNPSVLFPFGGSRSEIPGARILQDGLKQVQSMKQQVAEPEKLSTSEKKVLIDSMMQQLQQNMKLIKSIKSTTHQVAVNSIKNFRA